MQTVELAYDEFGRLDAPSLIILHGFFASSRNWRRIAEKFAESYHVLVPDLRNHGLSPHHPKMDYPSMMADVLGFMDSKGLMTAHIMGHSMGGKVAMWLALNHPGRTAKLIVVDIAPKTYSHSFDRTIQALIGLPLQQIRQRKQAEEWLVEAIPVSAYRQFLLQNLILQDGSYRWRVDLGIFKRQAHHIAAFPETERLPPHLGKTLFIAGGNSDYVSQNDVLGLFPNADYEQVAQAGHWLHVEQPEIFLQKTEKFLQIKP